MYVSLPITFLCTVGGAYLFGVALGLGVIGVYIGLAIDECVRGTIIWSFDRKQKNGKRRFLFEAKKKSLEIAN